jgi:hypothetical protein
MAKDEVFTAVRDSCTILGGFLTEVFQEVGRDRATEMYGRVFDGFGEMIANVVEEHRGDSEGAGKVAAYLEQLYEGFGIDAELEISPTTILTHSHACPFYDGYKAAGLGHETIESLCHSAIACEAAAFKRTVPDGNLSLTRFRATPDDFCTEAIELA